MDNENANAAPDAAHFFEPVFLVFCLLAIALSIFFLLYFNRLFAWLVARGIRTWTWRRYRVYIDFQALQISLLGGRVFFTGLRYHGPNETFFVQNGHITWRYWLRRVRDADVGQDLHKTQEVVEKVSAHQDGRGSTPPCRINVSLNGLEWFVYNRTPVYDGILRNLTEDEPAGGDNTMGPDVSNSVDEVHDDDGSIRRYGKASSSNNAQEEKSSDTSSEGSHDADASDLPILLELFPIHVNCRTAALVTGNENTKAILVAKTHELSGEIDASRTSAPDPYRQVFKLNFRHPVIEMKRNEDYREDQESRATKDGQSPKDDPEETRPRSSFLHRHRKLTRRLRNLVPRLRKSVESFSPSAAGPASPHLPPGANHWQGLSRYLQDDMEDKARWAEVEYAANPTIVDSPSATLSIFWDVPGKVGSGASSASTAASLSQDINGDTPPAWGMHLSIQGGIANYGPWADRQRAELQRFFFPSLSKDAIPAQPLKKGESRVSTKFTFYVELDEEVTVRIPTREPSKNWRYKDKNLQTEQNLAPQRQTRKQRAREKKTDADEATRIRPAGWLELKVAANATISYSTDTAPGQAGYSSTVHIDLPETELSTSVNHELLWRSGPQRISCDLSTPLKWNTLRTWCFDVSSEKLELFLLRDHVFLLIDLVDDWTTGPGPDYLVFTPFKYKINLDFTDLKVYFNVNDSNIINNPTSLEDNTYIVLSSQVLHAGVCIPIDTFRPTKNAVRFDIRADTIGVDLNLPLYNTQATFLRSKTIGQVENIVVDGCYHYNTTTSPSNIDTLVLNLAGQSPIYTAYGFTLRYVLGLKDNYFGDHIHFKTLEEYQELLRKEPGSEAQYGKPPPHPSNDLDVILGVRIDDPRLLLPRNLYDASHNIQVETPTLGADLRFTNYYMDLDLSISPLSLSLGTEDQTIGTPMPSSASTQLFVDGLRIYGHRLFGLPPSEPTYLCNWDLSVGAVSGECTAEFLITLARGAQAFIFDFDDEENALNPYSSIILHDVTFLRLAVQSVRVWLHVDEAAFLLSTDSISVNFNDWARTHYSKRANVKIPNLQLSCVDSEIAARHKSRYRHDISPEALFQTSVHLAIVGRKFEFSQERKLQQDLIRREDQRTHRTQFLLLPDFLGQYTPDGTDAPAQCVPPVPSPATEADLRDEESSAATSGLSAELPSVRRQSSFLSLSSSSGRSVIRTNPSRSRSRADTSGPQTERPGSRVGEFTNSEHHSAFYSAKGEHGHGEPGRPSAVTFSSQYFPPHFPLKHLRPDTTNAVMPCVDSEEDMHGPTDFDLEDVDPQILSEDHTYNSVIVEFPTGISCLITPTAVRYTTSLLAALQPSSPEDVLDELQVDSMTELIDLKHMVKVKGEIKDAMVRLPSVSIRLLSSPAAEYQKAADQSQDQYDVTANNIIFVTRETIKWENPYLVETKESRRSLHLRLDSLEATVLERFPDVGEVEAAVMAQVENTVISTGSRDLTYIDAQIRAVRATMASEKIEYLASLVDRTTTMAAEIGDLFSRVISKKDELPKVLAHKLAYYRPHAGDAPFFTRPSAILRSAEDHLRTFDSWKLAMRLRQKWSDMDAVNREQLYLECWGPHSAPPENAAEEVITAFQRWRSWDLGNLSQSVLLRNLFGLLSEKNETPSGIPLLAACQVGEVEMVLDPGPKENKTAILDVSVRVEHNDERHAASDGLPDVEGPLTTVNIYCDEAIMKVNWELCAMANAVLRLYSKKFDEQRTPTTEQPKEKKTPWSEPSQAFHVAFSVGRGSVSVDTVNLRAKSLTHGLTASLLVHGSGADATATNFLIACDGVTLRLHSHSDLLGTIQLRQPSIFASHNMQTSGSMDSHTVKSTASCRDFGLAIKQDPIALLEVADLLVRDELAQLYRLKSQLPQSSPEPQRRGRRIAEKLSAYRVNVALFLDEYNISIPLLQSLTYNVSGVVSRAAMAANFGREVIFDFDINENSHEIQIDVNNEPRGISLLSIPPTNGRITSLVGEGEHSISLFASIELIQLDAAAVYSLLRALNRPEITNTVSDIQEQVKIISGHLDDILDTEAVAEAAVNGHGKSKLVYSLHLTMAGLEIFGTTRLGLETHPAAHVLACIDRTHFEMSNRVEARGPVLEHPELHVHLGKILLDLQRGREGDMKSCGSVAFSAFITATTRTGADGQDERAFGFRSDGFEVNLSPDTVSTLMYVLNHLGHKIKDLDTSRELDYLRKLRQSKPRIAINGKEEEEEADLIDSFLSSFVYQFEVHNARLSWLIGDPDSPYTGKEDLVLSVKLFEFGTRKTKSARLTIQDFQLQMVPPGLEKHLRSHHSALLPEIIFNVAYVSTANARRLAFQAVGKALDIRLTSGFIMPASDLKDSLALSIENIQQASQNWNTGTSPAKTEETASVRTILGGKHLESLLADVDFAGAVVHLSAKKSNDAQKLHSRLGRSAGGKYGQFSDDAGGSVSLRSPGLALKMEYRDDGKDNPALSGEMKVEGSSNILYPTVVPLVLDITSGIKEVVSRGADNPTTSTDSVSSPRSSEGEGILTADAGAMLGRLKLNLGLLICKQEFTLSCQPIARVAASTLFEDIYLTVNTVVSNEVGNFLAMSAAISGLQASVQHVYSRESTGSFEVDSIVLSLMNSKHFSGKGGVSAILKFSPMKVAINAKQLQDFLLFREIWYPSELRKETVAPVKLQTESSQGHLVQRYQQVAATAAFPWTATVSISSVEISMDLGQAIGKTVFTINDFWVSSKKTSDWEQNLCLGFARVGADSTGRLSGFVALQDFRLRSLIRWPEREQALNETPLVQASIAFSQFHLKAAFDYQPFLVADITSIEFLMYNVRRAREGSGDRLVAIFDGNAIQVFGTPASAALGVALYQAVQRLVQERKGSFETSLREIERFMKRKSSATGPGSRQGSMMPKLADEDTLAKSPISLDTDVVVTLKALNLGVFSNTFSDQQVFKMEALDAQARFAANVVQRRVHSILDLTLGQLRIGLATVREAEGPKTLTDLSAEDVVRRATGSRGGTILKVPRVHAAMETWQAPVASRIEYIFKSAFEGKVEVGWNYSRISYIRGMWANHTRMLQQTWGKELAVTAIRVTGVPTSRAEDEEGEGQNKITAEVNVPQSRYEYVALEEPVIETPRLKEMGEATPPLEWIGLHRERLPNLTHQIVIVSLLELAGEVEDTYGRIMGSS